MWWQRCPTIHNNAICLHRFSQCSGLIIILESHHDMIVMWSPLFCLSFSTPAPALVTKATSKVPLSPRAPWDTRRPPSRAPNTPTRPTATEAPSHSLPAEVLLLLNQPWTSAEVAVKPSAPGKASLPDPDRMSFRVSDHSSSTIHLSPLTLNSNPTAFPKGTAIWRQTQTLGTKKINPQKNYKKINKHILPRWGSKTFLKLKTMYDKIEEEIMSGAKLVTHRLRTMALTNTHSSRGRIAAVFIYVYYIAPFSIWFFFLLVC